MSEHLPVLCCGSLGPSTHHTAHSTRYTVHSTQHPAHSTYHAAAGHTDAVGARCPTHGAVNDSPVEGGIEAEAHSTAVEGTGFRSCEGDVMMCY